MNNFIVFSISIFICIGALFFERLFGIGWDYHPDVLSYLSHSNEIVKSGAILNKLYYYIVYLTNFNLVILILINIFIYSLTNILIVNLLKKNCKFIKSYKSLVITTILLAAFFPYRLHLAIHALKDTFIIFILFAFLIQQGISKRFFLFILLSCFRMVSFIYILMFFRLRGIFVFLILTFAICTLLDFKLIDFFLERSVAGMHSRYYDLIPNFSDLGFIGLMTKMLSWPFFLLTGSFIIFSPMVLFVLFAMEMVVGKFFWFLFGNINIELLLVLFLVLALIAGLVDSFTSYIRYTYPIILIMPFINPTLDNN